MKNPSIFFGVLVCALFANFAIFTSCARIASKNANNTITVATWNVQTFFDANTDGTEFKEFLDEGKWHKDAYSARLEKLCNVLKTFSADVLVLCEVENCAVMQDIINLLPFNCKWRYATFYKDNKNAFGCGVFSSYPITDISAHQSSFIESAQITYGAQVDENGSANFLQNKNTPLRPLLQVTLKHPKKDINLVACHWKSKLNNNNINSAILRHLQEASLAQIFERCTLIEEDALCIATGDFNQNHDEFLLCDNFRDAFATDEFADAFTADDFATEDLILRTLRGITCTQVVKSAWDYFDTEPKGSYNYRDNWETIDNILLLQNKCKANFTHFEVLAKENLCKENGKPFAYRVHNGKGFSDHFAIIASLNID